MAGHSLAGSPNLNPSLSTEIKTKGMLGVALLPTYLQPFINYNNFTFNI
jgi:hypothetical protein